LQYSSKGELVPDEITIQLWKESIKAAESAGRYKSDIDYLLLDGIPRNVRQAQLMDEIIDVRRVFHLSCPEREKVVARLKKRALKDNRLDDANEEVIRRRLEAYDKESKPLLDYYGAKLVTTIDATQAPVKVLRDILDHIVSDSPQV
jgi:adenylate kinase